MSQNEQTIASSKQLTWLEILKFYLPLAAAAMIMIGSVNVVNSALSRTSDPQSALAAFAIGFSYAEMIAAPCFAGMSMLITLGKDKVYFMNTFKFMIKIMVIAILFIGVLAFTPIGRFVAIHLGGATEHLFDQIQEVWKWSLLLPIIYTSIAVSRSVILIEKSTYYVTIARFIRMGVMLVFASVLTSMNTFAGATIGTFIMLAGMSTEGIIGAIPAIRYVKRWTKTAGGEIHTKPYPPTQQAALRFVSPLIITSLMWGVSRPILFAGLARMENPELTIATYRVATNFIWLFMVLVEDNVKQMTIAFLREYADQQKTIIKFSAAISILVVIIILISALTPFGNWVITNVIGVEPTIAIGCMAPILVLSVYPIVQTVQEYYQGRLLLIGETKPLGFSKVLNIITMGIAVFVIAFIWPHIGPAAGAIALTLGMVTEMITMRHFAIKFRA